MKKLSLNKEIVSAITSDEMRKIAGGEQLNEIQETDLAWWGSRINCATNIPGDCSKSKSCNGGPTLCTNFLYQELEPINALEPNADIIGVQRM